MDSCQIFNFIFGTKKATTELSRCFSNIGDDVPAARGKPSTSSKRSSSRKEQPPKSPLKQLQSKLVNFVSKGQRNSDEDDPPRTVAALDSKAELISVQSGTYKASLVRSASDSCEEEPDLVNDKRVSYIVVNPIHVEQKSVEIIENPSAQQDDTISQHRTEAAPSSKEDKQVIYHDDDDKPINECREHDDNSNVINDKQATFRAERIILFEDDYSNQEGQVGKVTERNDKRGLYVRNLVRSFESGSGSNQDQARLSFDDESHSILDGCRKISADGSKDIRQNIRDVFPITPVSKPTTLVKPLPPKAPPKSFRAKCIRHQLSLCKPIKLQQLFQDEKFLDRFFGSLEPLDRCAAAQVCRKWRDILYSDHKYWRGLTNVIDCTQLRREHLVECIVNTLRSAKMKQQYKFLDITSSSSSSSTTCRPFKKSTSQQSGGAPAACFDLTSSLAADNELVNYDSKGGSEYKKPTLASDTIFGFDHEDVWRIQEICNRFAFQKHNYSLSKPQPESFSVSANQTSSEQHHQPICSASKSSSIPSQISSTFSSASLSSILSPLSESSRVETKKEKLYTSIDSRGFNAICLFGATDDDIEDFVCKIPTSSHERITIGRLNNCSITNRGLDRFIASFRVISELELTGCNELTNALELSPLTELRRLIITDCINIADGLAQKLIQILHRLTDLTIQAYHLTDAFIEFLSVNCDTSELRKLELPNCKEITNQSLIVLAKHFPKLEILSISGSTKISDDGIEILAEQANNLKSLDLSWCQRITDASLGCIACELSDVLTDLILDRNVNITDIGLGYLASMNKLTSLEIRWCARITDSGIESLIGMRSLKHLSLAGLHQITARSLLGLVEMDLMELELTNCPAVNDDLVMFLSTKLPNCNISF